MRVGSDWKSVIHKIERCRQSLPDISIVAQATATPASIKEIPKLLILLNRIGVDRFRLYFLRFSGVVARGGAVLISPSYYEDYIQALCEIASLVESGDLKGTQIETDGGYQSNLDEVLGKYRVPEISCDSHPCNYLQHILMIRSNGDIGVCPFFETAIRSYSHFNTIQEIQNHEPLIGWRSLKINQLDGCENCRYMKICQGGCRKSAFVLSGNGRAKDRTLCWIMPKLETTLWPLLSEKTKQHYLSQVNPDGVTQSYPKLN